MSLCRPGRKGRRGPRSNPGSRAIQTRGRAKIHAAVDALGLPIRFILGPGQQNDMAPARDLIRSIPASKVQADSVYDADSLHDLICEQGGKPVIPPRRHRKYQHRYDRIAYKQRWSSPALTTLT